MRWLWASALGLALTACGGGGGGGDDTPPVSNPPPTGSTPFNGNLSGLVVFRSADGAIMLDLQNGSRAALPLNLDFWPTLDGRTLSGIDTSTRNTSNVDTVRVLNLQLGTTETVQVAPQLSGLARLSPDRTMVAARWANSTNNETTPTLTIFNRQGQVVARHSTAGAFAWMPNGRLLMAQDRQLVVANADGTSPSTITTLSAAPLDVAPSRDGNRIAVTLPAGSGSRVWVMDANGANLRQLTTSASNERDAEWSADNQWVIVRQGVTGAAGNCPLVFAVPISATSAVDLSAANPSPAVRLRYKDAAGAALDFCPTSPVGWMR